MRRAHGPRPADTSRMQTAHSRRTYDPRIRETILESGERDLFPELRIPPSTIRSWFHRDLPEVTTCELASCDRAALLSEIRALRQRTARLTGVVGLLAALMRVSRHRVEPDRVADGKSKAALLRAIERAGKVLTQQQTATLTQGTQTQVHQQVSETSNWKRYRTRVASTATQVNLQFDDAKPTLEQGLVKSLAGIL